MIDQRLHLHEVIIERALQCATGTPHWQQARDARRKISAAYGTLSHNLANQITVRQAIKPSDLHHTRTIPELDPETMQLINHTMEQEEKPEKHNETFCSSSPTHLWLPSSTLTYRGWYKHILHITFTTNNDTLTCLATKDVDNITSGTHLGGRVPHRS